MRESIVITSQLAIEQRAALERLLFFNENQHRVRDGIEQSIATYGVPEIYEQGASLRIRVSGAVGVQTLFAVAADGRPLGVAVFLRPAPERLLVLHVGVAPRMSAQRNAQRRANSAVLLRLMHEIHSTARRTHGVDSVELVYKVLTSKERDAVRSR